MTPPTQNNGCCMKYSAHTLADLGEPHALTGKSKKYVGLALQLRLIPMYQDVCITCIVHKICDVCTAYAYGLVLI